jgi:hypothetical protein
MPTLATLEEAQFALTDVYSNAGIMVRTLASMQQGVTTSVQAVKDFQEAWNDNIPVLRTWVGDGGGVPWEADLPELLTVGLTADGRYGRKTGVALGELLWLIDESLDAAANSVPVVVANMPVWYAQHHSAIEGALGTNFSTALAPGDIPVSIDPEEITEAVLADEAENTAQIPLDDNDAVIADDSGSDISFEDHIVTSTAGRAGWSVPIWALGLGLVTAGTLIFFVAKKTRRRGSASV